MTKTIAILACFCWPFTAAFAQQNHLKLYLGFELANRWYLAPPSQSSTMYRYTQDYSTEPFYAVAFAHEKRSGNFLEISGQTNAYIGFQKVYPYTGLDTLQGLPVAVGKQRNSYAQLQYEYNWLQGVADDRKVRPYLGLFLRASGEWASFRPSTTENFGLQHWGTTISPGFVPRLIMKFGDRWHLDLSAPIVMGNFGFSSYTIKDPALTKEQQKSSSIDINMLTLDTQIKVGVAYMLNKPAVEAPR